VASLIFNPSSTNTIFYPSKTNAPVGVVTETNTLTGLIAGLYVFQVRAVSAEGVKSDNSKALTNRIGAPKTVPLFITK
jgi:predicted phage tail protein